MRNNYSKFKRKFHYYPSICFSTVSPILSKDLKELINHLDIKSNVTIYDSPIKTESLKYIHEISGCEGTERFMNLTKPKNTKKKSRYLIWKKFGFCPTNTTYEQRKQILKGKLNPHSFYEGPIV